MKRERQGEYAIALPKKLRKSLFDGEGKTKSRSSGFETSYFGRYIALILTESSLVRLSCSLNWNRELPLPALKMAR